MTPTFSLPICQRIAKVLGDKRPELHFFWTVDQDGVWDFVCQNELELLGKQVIPAFTLQDMTAGVWKALGEKLGWSKSHEHFWPNIAYGEAHGVYESWLTGGYEAAEKYLDTILPK